MTIIMTMIMTIIITIIMTIIMTTIIIITNICLCNFLSILFLAPLLVLVSIKKLLVFFFFEPLSCKCRFRRHRKHIRYWAWQSRWSKYLFWKGDNHDHNVRWCLTISWIREKGNRVVVRILKLKLKFFTMLLFCSLMNDIWMWRIEVWRG